MIQNNSIMNNVFWGLKDSWWKQIYDAKYHQFGSDVFDKGLHEGNIEPGFYNSIKNASEYAAEQMGTPLTIECYNRIHQLACEHFPNVKRSQINVDEENIDNFRNTDCRCCRDLVNHSYEYENESQFEKKRLSFVLLNRIRLRLNFDHNIRINGCKTELNELSDKIKEQITNKLTRYNDLKGINITELFENGNEIYEKAIESNSKIIKQLEETQKRLHLSKPFIALKNILGEEILIYAYYLHENPKEIETVIHKLINDYNEKMQTLPPDPMERSNEENEFALKCIAELFQNLEWLHPFFDGQGRTDLVLLAKLLTENGFNPSILYNPYYSTFEPLEKWISYLKEGIEAWKVEKEKT